MAASVATQRPEQFRQRWVRWGDTAPASRPYLRDRAMVAALEPARDIADRLVVRGVECEHTTEEQHQLLVEQGQLVVRPRASHRVLLRAAGLKRALRRDLGQRCGRTRAK